VSLHKSFFTAVEQNGQKIRRLQLMCVVLIVCVCVVQGSWDTVPVISVLDWNVAEFVVAVDGCI